MSNPILNEKAAAQAAKAGWAAPDPATAAGPISDGPISEWRSANAMTVSGTATATGVLLVLLLAAAAFGWASVDPNAEYTGFPTLAIVGIIVGFVCAIAVSFRPMLARWLGPVYALGEGFFLGVVSRAYDAAYDGIVVQAVGATLAVFATMLKTAGVKASDVKTVTLGFNVLPALLAKRVDAIVAYRNVEGVQVRHLRPSVPTLEDVAASIESLT